MEENADQKRSENKEGTRLGKSAQKRSFLSCCVKEEWAFVRKPGRG